MSQALFQYLSEMVINTTRQDSAGSAHNSLQLVFGVVGSKAVCTDGSSDALPDWATKSVSNLLEEEVEAITTN